MRSTQPKTRLIARPQIDWDAIDGYLEEIGGVEWGVRMDRRLDDQPPSYAFHEGETLIEFGGRLCYRSWKPGLNANVSKVRTDSGEYFENLLASGHGSVLEHANYTFLFQDVSRVFTHELVRHRAGAAYSQESMRFVRLTDIPFWFPDWAQQDAELMSRCLYLLEAMEDHQKWMADWFRLDDPKTKFSEKKAKTSFMRRFAPDGVSTAIVATFNIRALRHIIKMRTDPSAEEEIRIVLSQVAEIMKQEAPLLFADFKQGEDGWWKPEHVKV